MLASTELQAELESLTSRSEPYSDFEEVSFLFGEKEFRFVCREVTPHGAALDLLREIRAVGVFRLGDRPFAGPACTSEPPNSPLPLEQEGTIVVARVEVPRFWWFFDAFMFVVAFVNFGLSWYSLLASTLLAGFLGGAPDADRAARAPSALLSPVRSAPVSAKPLGVIRKVVECSVSRVIDGRSSNTPMALRRISPLFCSNLASCRPPRTTQSLGSRSGAHLPIRAMSTPHPLLLYGT